MSNITKEQIEHVAKELLAGSNWLSGKYNVYSYNRQPKIAAMFLKAFAEQGLQELIYELEKPENWKLEGFGHFKDVTMSKSDVPFRAAEMLRALSGSEQLQAKNAELEEENARLRTVPMKYRRMAFNAQLQDENNELRAQLAAAQEECEFQRNAHKQAEELMLEQSNQLAATQEEMNDWRNQAHQSQSAFDRLQDQLAKAEQRVAEWQPIETAPKGERFLTTTKLSNGSFGQVGISHSFFCYEVNTRDWEIAGDDPCATHWMPLPKAPNGASS